MFRSTIARAAASVTRAIAAAPVQTATVARFALAGRRIAVVPTARPAVAAMAVRWYSAGGGLEKEEVEGRIISLLKGFDKVNDASNIKASSHFANDLGLDSLDTVEVVMAIEEEFSIEIPDKDADTIHSVDKAVEYILHQPDAH
ncbi:acyl carrier protein [Grosmannia clavigera kw1407]|uniref:Acyl carrier protein n=1 Tax=Grosmannia clavigera (strain kw1407 / UAMH 11150) TaxID=655863 RepID=F0XF73_GROCL|nr:acyl carrier protein [Grosmannia clavigera kw1407]EFX04770.1 acyl carrier protein [Grosmannia clavigera kw1407]